MKVILAFFAVIAAFALGSNLGYFQGFDDGSDAALCAMAIKVDGTAAAMHEHECLNIKGKKPPVRIFPGSNGDEPTIWNRR
jgi:hypothetical protein